MLVAEKSFDSVLDDETFWITQRELVAKLVAPLWKAMWLEGAQIAGEFSTQALKDLEAVEAAADQFIDEYTNEWWQRVETTTRERMRQVIQEARVDGKTTQWVIDQLASLFGPERAVGIAVTEMTNLLGGGAQARYRADGWTAWEWRTVVDRRVCPECESRDGNEYPISERFEAAHPGCVVAGTLISAVKVEGATLRPFDGEVIVLRTAGGNELTITPNHPVLRRSGWVAAGLLREGDDVVCHHLAEGSPPVGPDNQELPAGIEEIAGALRRSGSMTSVRVPSATEQFHGDGSDGYVDVVRPAGHLGSGLLTPVSQPGHDPRFHWRGYPQLLDRGSPILALAPRGFSAPGRVMRGGNLGGSLVCRHGRPFHTFGRALGPRPDSRLQEAPANHKTVHPKAFGDGIFGLASDVPVDHRRIVENDSVMGLRADTITIAIRRPFRGHVYNLQSADGWYAANSVIVANCRCWPVPAGVRMDAD